MDNDDEPDSKAAADAAALGIDLNDLPPPPPGPPPALPRGGNSGKTPRGGALKSAGSSGDLRTISNGPAKNAKQAAAARAKLVSEIMLPKTDKSVTTNDARLKV
jgi:hypothetical protein